MTMQHHESLPLTACMNAFAACMNIDRLHEHVGSVHERVDSMLIGCMKALSACTKACMNTLRPGGQGRRDSYGSAAMARSSVQCVMQNIFLM